MNPTQETSPAEYLVGCRHCLSEYDALTSIWCSCSATTPTKLCPFCLSCLCAQPEFKEAFWSAAPPALKADRETLQKRRMLLGDILLAAGKISTDQLIAALHEQSKTGEKLGACLVRLGVITAAELQTFLEGQHAPTSLDIENRVVHASLAERVGPAYCMSRRILPVEMETLNGRRIALLAMANPSDSEAIDFVRDRLEAHVIPGFSPEAIILATIADLFPDQASRSRVTSEAGDRTASGIVESAIRCGATQIQVDVTPAISRLCYRVDGTLYRMRTPSLQISSSHTEALLSWFGGTSPSLRTIEVDGRGYDLLLRLQRTGGATSIQIHVQETTALAAVLPLDRLDPGSRRAVREAVGAPTGLMIVTGAAHTGSESSFWGLVNLAGGPHRPVTLGPAPFPFPEPWASRSETSGSPAPILAILEPAPRQLEALIQEAGKRLVLLHLTGRRAGSFVRRFLKVGVGPPRLASVLSLLLEHRAARRLCAHGRSPQAPPPAARSAATPAAGGDSSCAACAISPGYRGRESLIAALPGRGSLASQIHALGPRVVWEPLGLEAALHTAGLDLVRRGLTSLEELRRLRLTPGH